IRLEAVHLDEQLIEGLLALVIAAAEARAAMPAHRVDFVDKDNAGCILLTLLEHISDAACTDADEHLAKIGTRDREEGDVRLAGDGGGEQRLAGAGGTYEQPTLRDLAPQPLKFLRVLQVFDDLLELLFRLVDAGDILKGDPPHLFRQQPRPAFAEPHRPPAAA